MKISTRFVFRKMKSNRRQMLGMGVLIFVAALFFTTIFSFVETFRQRTEGYFAETGIADATLTGNFSEEDIAKLAGMGEVKAVEGRTVQDFKTGTKTVRLQSVTSEISRLQLEKGRLPESEDECAVLIQYAREENAGLGDSLTAGEKKLKITGIVSSSEYMYYVQNARTIFADTASFAVAFVSGDFFPASNQLVITGKGVTEKKLASAVAFEQFTKQENQIGYQMYEGDLDQFRAFAYIFPAIFWLMSFCIIFILLKRTIMKEHKQIGVMKAQGISNRIILKVYLLQFGILGLAASLLGCLASIFVSQWVMQMIKVMIELPGLAFRFYPLIWLAAIGISVAGCLLSGMLSLLNVFRELPADAMRPRMPGTSRQSLIERVPMLWRSFSFNTRYAIKSTLRNKGRFLVMVLGVAASTALLVFSFGFNDSFRQLSRQYFDDFASYEAVVESETIPLEANLLDEVKNADQIDKVLQLAVKVDDEEYPLQIVEEDISLLKLSGKSIKKGVVIPEYYAGKWQVKAGDKITISDVSAEISEIIPLSFGLSIFTSYDYASEIFADFPKVHNALYLKTSDLDKLEKELKDTGLVYTTAEDDKVSFDAMLENLRALIILLLVCGGVLGVTVILCISLMNLTIREFEYMFMNIMGYSKGKILQAIAKETAVQLLIAIPLGFAGGYLLLDAIKGEFSQNTFALYPAISSSSYLLSAVLVLVISSTKFAAAGRFIDQLDIVEGLKVQED